MFALISDDILKVILSHCLGYELIALRHTNHYFFERTNELYSYALISIFFPLVNDNKYWQRPDKLTLEYLQDTAMKYTLLRQVEFKCIKTESHPTYWQLPFWVTHGFSGYNNGYFHASNIDSVSRLFKSYQYEHWVEVRRTEGRIDCRFTKYGAQYRILIKPFETCWLDLLQKAVKSTSVC